MKINVLLLVVFIIISCKNEKNITVIKEKECITEKKEFFNFENTNTIMNEEFDLAFYEMVKDNIPYIRKDGSRIYNIGFDKNIGGAMSETFAPPSFLSCYKEFYPNTHIKK